MKNLNVNRITLDSVYISLLLFGAFLFLMIPSFLRLPFYFFTVPLKYLILIYSIFIIFNAIIGKRKGVKYKKKYIICIILFWFLFLSRMIIDLEIFQVSNFVFQNNFAYYQSAIYCIFPCISIFFLRALNFNLIGKLVVTILLISCICSLFLNFGDQSSELQTSYGRFEGAQGMSSIDYGHYGVTLSLLTFYFFNIYSKISLKIFFLLCFLLGLFVIYLSGSRSPFLALIFCLVFFLIVYYGMFKGFYKIFLLILPILFYSSQIISFLESFGGNFFERLLAFTEGNDKGGRDILLQTSLNQFLDSPIFGSSFLINQGFGIGIYPHNLLVESFMAIGFFGGFLFLYLMFKSLYFSFLIIKNRSKISWLALLYIQYTILSFASLAIYTHSKYWFLLSLIIVLYSKNDKIVNKKYKFNFNEANK